MLGKEEPQAPQTLSHPILQENQGPALANSGSPKDSPAHEATAGERGAYTRFDVPRARVERGWPSFRGGWPGSSSCGWRPGGGVGGRVLTEPAPQPCCCTGTWWPAPSGPTCCPSP